MEAPDDNFSLFKSVKRDLRNGSTCTISCLFSYFTRSGFPSFVWKVAVVVFKFPQTKLLFKTVVNAIIHAPAAHTLFPPNTYLTSWEKAGRGRKIAHFFKTSRFSYVRERRGSGIAAIILDNLSLFAHTKGKDKDTSAHTATNRIRGRGKRAQSLTSRLGLKRAK